jgi:hypothetical protein
VIATIQTNRTNSNTGWRALANARRAVSLQLVGAEDGILNGTLERSLDAVIALAPINRDGRRLRKRYAKVRDHSPNNSISSRSAVGS